MKLNHRLSSLFASCVALVLWGCSGEQVESGAEATANGMHKVGGALEHAGAATGKKLEDVAKGSKVEGAADAVAHGLEKGGEKAHAGLDKAGDKLKEASVPAGKMVDKAADKIKDVGKKVGEEIKELKDKATSATTTPPKS